MVGIQLVRQVDGMVVLKRIVDTQRDVWFEVVVVRVTRLEPDSQHTCRAHKGQLFPLRTERGIQILHPTPVVEYREMLTNLVDVIVEVFSRTADIETVDIVPRSGIVHFEHGRGAIVLIVEKVGIGIVLIVLLALTVIPVIVVVIGQCGIKLGILLKIMFIVKARCQNVILVIVKRRESITVVTARLYVARTSLIVPAVIPIPITMHCHIVMVANTPFQK